MTPTRSVFVTVVRSPAEKAAVRRLIDSIRTFGGVMAGCPVWVFTPDPSREHFLDLAGPTVEVVPLEVPQPAASYPFAGKVLACARAEALVSSEIQSLVWLDPDCLVVQPPELFSLGEDFDAALRPVHIGNVGLAPSEPRDEFWNGICAALGIVEVPGRVESFVDRRRLRSYFNSHGFSINPARGLLRAWRERFEGLVRDKAFQAAACRDETHRTFLFQAVLSALVASTVDERRIRILPPTYNYPYHLHTRVPAGRRAAALNDLDCLAYEGRTLCPGETTDIEIREPLRSWLSARFTAGPVSRGGP